VAPTVAVFRLLFNKAAVTFSIRHEQRTWLLFSFYVMVKIHIIYGFYMTETTTLPQPWVGFEYHKSTSKSPKIMVKSVLVNSLLDYRINFDFSSFAFTDCF
jgi:hypothetical protein